MLADSQKDLCDVVIVSEPKLIPQLVSSFLLVLALPPDTGEQLNGLLLADEAPVLLGQCLKCGRNFLPGYQSGVPAVCF